MISTGRAFGLCGKGITAENVPPAQGSMFGWCENIVPTVTACGGVLLDILVF